MKNKDTIYRQTAIEAFYNATADGDKAEWGISIINSLPSAPSEITAEQVKEYCERRCLVVISSVLFAQMQKTFSQPELIRCIDCRRWDDSPSSTFAPTFHRCNAFNYNTEASEFCSRAERKKA